MKARVMAHLRELGSAFGQLARRPVSAALTLSGIGVALCLPLLLQAMSSNLDRAFATLPGHPSFTVYLDPSLASGDQQSLIEAVSGLEGVSGVTRVGREEGLRGFLESAGLQGLEELMGENPLPDMLEIAIDGEVDHARLDHLAGWLESRDGVDEVLYDLAWKERLDAIRDLVRRALAVFWALLLAGVGLVIGNSVRLGLVTARDEIEVISLVGGSGSYIRRPYLYHGMLQALAGAVLAIILARLIWWQLAAPVARLLSTYAAGAEVRFVPPGDLLMLVAAAASIGWTAALVTVNRYLGKVLPR